MYFWIKKTIGHAGLFIYLGNTDEHRSRGRIKTQREDEWDSDMFFINCKSLKSLLSKSLYLTI